MYLTGPNLKIFQNVEVLFLTSIVKFLLHAIYKNKTLNTFVLLPILKFLVW